MYIPTKPLGLGVPAKVRSYQQPTPPTPPPTHTFSFMFNNQRTEEIFVHHQRLKNGIKKKNIYI